MKTRRLSNKFPSRTNVADRYQPKGSLESPLILSPRQCAHQGLTIDPVGLHPPTPARGQDRGGVDHMALAPFGLQHPADPEAIQTGLLDDDNREVPAGPPAALRLSSANRRRSSDTSLAGTECFDIFSPPPGDRDVISQTLRDSSIETKITPSSVRIAACAGRDASSGIVASKSGGQQPHSQRAPVASQTPMGSIGAIEASGCRSPSAF